MVTFSVDETIVFNLWYESHRTVIWSIKFLLDIDLNYKIVGSYWSEDENIWELKIKV